jgi:hypothetical protein
MQKIEFLDISDILLKTVSMYTDSLVVLMCHFVDQKHIHNLADILCSISLLS